MAVDSRRLLMNPSTFAAMISLKSYITGAGASIAQLLATTPSDGAECGVCVPSRRSVKRIFTIENEIRGCGETLYGEKVELNTNTILYQQVGVMSRMLQGDEERDATMSQLNAATPQANAAIAQLQQRDLEQGVTISQLLPKQREDDKYRAAIEVLNDICVLVATKRRISFYRTNDESGTMVSMKMRMFVLILDEVLN
jgi:hypothetical protein